MKRTLWEIGGAVTLMATLALFQHELAEMRTDHRDRLARAEAQLAVTERQSAARTELEATREDLFRLVDARLHGIEQSFEEVSQGVRDASYLERELAVAKREAESLKTRIARDVDETRSRVDEYADTLRTVSERSRQLSEQRDVLDALRGRVLPDKAALTRDLLLPTVQLEGRDTVGSGTLVSSSRDADSGEVENWVLTAYHVCRNILADSADARRDGLRIRLYLPDGEQLRVRGELVAHESAIDVALVRVMTDRVLPNVARVVPRARAGDVAVWDEILAIGCPLGTDPVPTRGTITSTDNIVRGSNYWMINAPTYYGNSGGGVFLSESRELTGVFSKIYTHGTGIPVVVPHMGLCTPLATVYDWLDDEGLGHVLPQSDAVEHAEPQLAAPAK